MNDRKATVSFVVLDVLSKHGGIVTPDTVEAVTEEITNRLTTGPCGWVTDNCGDASGS